MGHFKQSVKCVGRLHLIWERLELKSRRNKSRRHQALPHPAASNSAEVFRNSFLAVHWLCSGDRTPGHCDGDGLLCQWLPEDQVLHGSCLGWVAGHQKIRVCAVLTRRWTVTLLTPPPQGKCLIRVQFLIQTPIHLFLRVKGPAKQFLCTRFLFWYCTCVLQELCVQSNKHNAKLNTALPVHGEGTRDQN